MSYLVYFVDSYKGLRSRNYLVYTRLRVLNQAHWHYQTSSILSPHSPHITQNHSLQSPKQTKNKQTNKQKKNQVLITAPSQRKRSRGVISKMYTRLVLLDIYCIYCTVRPRPRYENSTRAQVTTSNRRTPTRYARMGKDQSEGDLDHHRKSAFDQHTQRKCTKMNPLTAIKHIKKARGH